MKKGISVLLSCSLVLLSLAIVSFPVSAYDMGKKNQAVTVSSGNSHCVVILSDGSLWAWGNNDHGQLGYGNGGNSTYSVFYPPNWEPQEKAIQSLPKKVLDDAVAVSAGEQHTAAITSDGTLWTWGSNYYCELGDGTYRASSVPIKVMDDAVAVSAGYQHTVAIKNDGSLWSWGASANGQLGDGTIGGGAHRNGRVPVKIMDDVISVSAGRSHTMAIKSDNSLWAWGLNSSGQLGIGSTENSAVPVKVMENVIAVSAGTHHTAAITVDGALWSWGRGSLGNGTYESNVPVKIMDDVIAVSTGNTHTVAIKSDYSLWAWGGNYLGNGKTAGKNQPIKILGNVVSVSAGNMYTMAVTSDGVLWAWGKNEYGQLGNGGNGNDVGKLTYANGSIIEYPVQTTPERILDNVSLNKYTVDSDENLLDETILRARMLTNSHVFRFYRTWDGPVRIMVQNLDPTPSGIWYALENYTDIYYNAIKNGADSPADVLEITETEFYEYLLLKMLDNREFQYYSLQELFTPVSAVSGERIDVSLLKKLATKGVKRGAKLQSKDMTDVKALCEAFLGSDEFLDIGSLDAILVPGKTVDEFVSEFVALYQLSTVSDARANAIHLVWENASDPALKQAAWSVYTSIQSAKKEGISYYSSGAVEKSLDSIIAWLLDKTFDILCDADPAIALWKKTADGTMAAMDTIFLTDDVSTDTLYLMAMANLDASIRSAIDKAESSFLTANNLKSATGLIALAELYQREMLVGCDVVNGFINHCERGELNWHGILDALSMLQKGKLDFTAFLRWMFGDPNSSWSHLRESVSTIRKGIEHSDYYNGVDVMLSLREIRSTTPSVWATEEVNKAISYRLLPENMRNNYQSNITRLEYCLLLEYMIEGKTGKTVAQWIEDVGTQIQPPFDDALYTSVNNIARLGIIKGVGENRFNPLGEITRQEAATMLYRTAVILGYDTSSNRYDEQGIADWAQSGVDFVTSHGIMNGTGNGFEPQGKYTKEQSILTMVRFFEEL